MSKAPDFSGMDAYRKSFWDLGGSLRALRTFEQDRKATTTVIKAISTRPEVGINIPFTEGDPTSFKTYFGQSNTKTRLALRIKAMKRGESLKALFAAPAGVGKTALARVVAHEMVKQKLVDNYIEFVAGKLGTKKEVDQLMKQIPPYSLVFIDEIHGLHDKIRDLLLPAIQDGQYAYTRSTTMEALPIGLSWVGATTDLGQVHPALQRRMNVIHLEPMGLRERVSLIKSLSMSITDSAAKEIASRTWTPWEVKDEVYATARDIALYRKRKSIILDHAQEALALLGIDDNGLKERDRIVLNTLYNSAREVAGEIRYGMSARSLVAISGLDLGTYLDAVEPKLLRSGFIRITTIGRELTQQALETYFV